MNTEYIRANYNIIHPLSGPGLDPQMQYDAVITHGHFTIDVTGSVPTLVHAAVEAGIDTIWTSGHDTTKEYDLVRNVVSDNNYSLEVQPAIEISARGPKNKLRHVMVYGVEDAPPPGLTPEQVNRWAHEHGPHVRTALAHPELLFFSVKSHELAKNQTDHPPEEQYDLGEIGNGGVVSIDAWRKKHPIIAKVVGSRLPSERDNEKMGEIVIAQFKLPALGGDDFHHPSEVGNVINLVPHGENVFDAAMAGNLLIAVKRNPVAPALWRMGVGTFKGAIKDRKIKHKWRGASKSNFIAAA